MSVLGALRENKLRRDLDRRQRFMEQDAAMSRQQTSAGLRQFMGAESGEFGPPVPAFNEQNPVLQADTLAKLVQAQGIGPSVALQAMQPQAGQNIGVPSPKDFTAQSLQDFQESGNYTDLVRYQNPQAQRRLNMAEDRLLLQQIAQSRPSDGQMDMFISGFNQMKLLDDVNELMNPDYFGHGLKVIGDGRDWVEQRRGGKAAQDYVTFWNNYRWWEAEVRKSLIGTQMTPMELADFNRRVVKPEDSYDVAVAKLQQQRQMIRDQLTTRSSVLGEYGYNTPTLPFKAPPAEPETDGTVDLSNAF